MVYILSQRFPGNSPDVEIDVLGVTNTLPIKAEIASSLQTIEVLVHSCPELGEEEKMKPFNSLNSLYVHAILIRALDICVNYVYNVINRMANLRKKPYDLLATCEVLPGLPIPD